MGRQSAATAPKVDRERIVEVGLRLLEEQGFEQLSLRRIAEELGVQTPALYWHIRDRAELYGLMTEAMLRESVSSVDPELTGRDFLVALGRSLHVTHMHRRDSAHLIALAKPNPDSAETAAIVRRLAAGGIERAGEALSVIYAFTLGWSLFRTNRYTEAAMARRIDVAEAFELGLDAIAKGFCEKEE
jgi:TetR/AcrR family tetracycline transcriptional repressor